MLPFDGLPLVFSMPQIPDIETTPFPAKNMFPKTHWAGKFIYLSSKRKILALANFT